jgi:hypothetical protein
VRAQGWFHMSMKHDVRICTFPAAILLAIALVAGCGGMTTSSPSTSVSPPSATGTGDRVALGANNPAQGDCTTNTSETATSVGFVVLTLTPSSFEADVQLQSGFPNTTYGVFMQQVPGSCPQSAANGGTLTTDSTGRGQASTEVARVPSATTFYVQLVPAGVGPPDYTSDRVAATS